MKNRIYKTLIITLFSTLMIGNAFAKTPEEVLNRIRHNHQLLVDNGVIPGATSSSANKSTPKAKKCEHQYSSEISCEETCVAAGVVKYTCDLCGNEYTEEIAPNGNHSYTEEVISKADCLTKGMSRYTCEICGDSYTEETNPLGHDYEETITTTPTCVTGGIITYSCSRCGDTYTEETEALGHSESEWITIKNPSLFFKGHQVKRCMVCNEQLEAQDIESKYPTWILYAVAGTLILLIAVLIIIIPKIKYRKTMKTNFNE